MRALAIMVVLAALFAAPGCSCVKKKINHVGRVVSRVARKIFCAGKVQNRKLKKAPIVAAEQKKDAINTKAVDKALSGYVQRSVNDRVNAATNNSVSVPSVVIKKK